MKIEEIHELRKLYVEWQSAQRQLDHLTEMLTSKHDGWQKGKPADGQQGWAKLYHKRLRCLNSMVEDNYISDATIDKLMKYCLHALVEEVQEAVNKARYACSKRGIDTP